MKLTPEQIAKIRQKEAKMPDALKRSSEVDYYHGWFFVTLNTRNDVPVLSVCEGDVRKANGEIGAPRCVYTKVGRGVLETWKRAEAIYPNVKVDIAEAMPDHFHGLIRLLPGNNKHLGMIIKGFMIGCTHAYWDTLGIDWRNMGYVKGVRTPEYGDKDHTRSYRGPALFVHGYNDMEPVTEGEVEVKRAYIRDQARKRLIQGDNHECFRKYRHQHSRNWTVERCQKAIGADRCFKYDAANRERAMANVQSKLNKDAAGICLDYIGNKSLLYSEKKLPLVCHRADAARFEEQKAAVLSAARDNWVIVSAFISQKERDIKQQLMVEQLPFIEIMDNGFSDKYKGTGKAFYALAENRLCQISPWVYEYLKDGTMVSREMCLVMNELARMISGREDDWWKTWK